jgi:nitroreductase
MNPLLHFIFNRRSVRKYENREIPADNYFLANSYRIL